MSGPTQHASMRASNLAHVLGAIAGHGPLPRAAISTQTGLTKSSVSGLVAELVEAGLASEAAAPTGDGSRGRPGTSVGVAAGGAAGLGLEVNVDYLSALVVDLGGTVRHRHVIARDNRSRPAGTVLADLAGLAQAAAASAAEQGLPLAGACLAVPGAVDGRIVRRAPNLDWHDVEVTLDPGPSAYGLGLENEANLAALAELWTGTTPDTFVHVSGEIGIGAGLVVEGELFRGAHGRAGELGHVVVDANGPACSCGGRGCLERLAGQDAILAGSGAADRAELEQLCGAGDERAVAAVEQAGDLLGTALASTANLLDPDAIVLGGSFAALAPWLRGAVEESLARHAVRTPVTVSTLGTEAAVRGAALSVVRRVVADPAGYLGLLGDLAR